MLQDILEALKRRKEEMRFAGHDVVVHELTIDDDLGFEDMSTPEAVKAAEDEAIYRLAVRSVFFRGGEHDGKPVFTDADIPAMRAAGKGRIGKLIGIVRRVNGLDGNDNAKN